MECIGIMVMAVMGIWVLTKCSNCIGNVFGCMLFMLFCMVLAAMFGVS